MSTSSGAGSGSLGETPDRRAPTWPRLGVIAAVLVLAFIVSRSCQQAEIDLTEAEAVAKATEQVDFVPEDTQVRLLRQGIERHPFWIISLSTEAAGGQTYEDLAVLRIDATTGEIVEFREQGAEKRPSGGAGGGGQAEPEPGEGG